jgi:hypothetical protein
MPKGKRPKQRAEAAAARDGEGFKTIWTTTRESFWTEEHMDYKPLAETSRSAGSAFSAMSHEVVLNDARRRASAYLNIDEY